MLELGRGLLSGSHNHTLFTNGNVLHQSPNAIREQFIDWEAPFWHWSKSLGGILGTPNFTTNKGIRMWEESKHSSIATPTLEKVLPILKVLFVCPCPIDSDAKKQVSRPNKTRGPGISSPRTKNDSAVPRRWVRQKRQLSQYFKQKKRMGGFRLEMPFRQPLLLLGSLTRASREW